jgi:hypothetical protein
MRVGVAATKKGIQNGVSPSYVILISHLCIVGVAVTWGHNAECRLNTSLDDVPRRGPISTRASHTAATRVDTVPPTPHSAPPTSRAHDAATWPTPTSATVHPPARHASITGNT